MWPFNKRSSFRKDYWKKPRGLLRLDKDIEEVLKLCAKHKEVRTWNQWRRSHPKIPIYLEGADLRGLPLPYIDLRDACMTNARLEGTDLYRARLEGAWLQTSLVDSNTSLWKCYVDKQSNASIATNFRGVAIANARIDPGTKTLIEYNTRRLSWEEWYLAKHSFFRKLFVSSFWLTSDYGFSSLRIIFVFILLSILFAIVYFLFPSIVSLPDRTNLLNAFCYAIYYSVVTMTTLGFGDIHANPESLIGQVLLMAQVLIGYFMLGALVTRLGILFSAGGPSARFSNKYKPVPDSDGCE